VHVHEPDCQLVNHVALVHQLSLSIGGVTKQEPTERLIMTGDEAVELLIKWMRDEEVPYGVRAKIAQDIADRAGKRQPRSTRLCPRPRTRC
jgi:hypothetical protein